MLNWTARSSDLIGMRVRRTREFRGMSQEAFAAGLGLSLHQIKKFESGFERIGAVQLAAICMSLQVRPSFFFADLKSKPGAATAARSTDGASNGVDEEMVENLSATLAALAEQKALQNTAILDLLRKLEAELRAGRPLERPVAPKSTTRNASSR